ncbi:unnamed protein product [Cyclocybe aegerita]|uniref:BTB domain-containing protein n=1 Tax=Cyclocybe aegerita TaxID=1973307 RepID=A0A8S0W2P9_CYCAE|nr:unnamed protein product [Cyclocybe aegerita]
MKLMHSPGPSPSDIQSHLYTSFIQASTYDVAIRVSGTWNAVYRLHRVVLIQSEFFRSLFTAGFSESSNKHSIHRNGADEISVIFDDFNITRPAFEVCISCLYGGGPILHVSPNLIATTNHPLTPPFSGVSLSADVPTGHHFATPRFLLSLLATAIYLSMPSVASQALALILKTVGPTTVLPYLNFACGMSLTYCHVMPEDTQPAVGLESVAVILDDEIPMAATTRAIEGLKIEPSSAPKASMDGAASRPRSEGGSSESDGEFEDLADSGPSYHYGAVSDKIGEACACWLARWATDMLQLEDRDANCANSDLPDSRTRSKSLSSVGTVDTTPLPSILVNPPVIWGVGGLKAEWVAALVSADTLFVKNEWERYNFARAVVELRRRNGIIKQEERVWNRMFEYGICYMNMTFEDILFISQDISPTTKRLYVPLSVMQASHWAQSVLRNQITSRPSQSIYNPSGCTTGTTSPPPRDKELGITWTTADILSKLSEVERNVIAFDKNKSYFPVSCDQSLRIGDNGSNPTGTGTQLSMEELFSSSHQPSPRQPQATGHDSSSKISTTEANFFGILTLRHVAHTCVDLDPAGKLRWTPYPPYRFSVEFWDVDLLKEKSRLHSQTIWHAGSLFNIYVQLVRKKGQAQLGIYLHRQSSVDPIPTPSSPSTPNFSISASDRQLHHRKPSLPSLLSQATPSSPTHYSPSIHPPSRSSTPRINNSSPSPPSSPPAVSPVGYGPIPASIQVLTPTSAPQQPYRDPRSSISAYFAISCASATGSSQTRFSSAPDTFSVSQSWGWKSSSLRTEEFLEVGTQALPSSVSRGKEVSLRATVVLGLV